MSIATIFSGFIKNWSSKEELYFKIGVASDIDESDFTFKFTPIDEKSVVEDVRMKVIADGSLESFVIIPKEGTKVVVGFHSNVVGQCLFVQESEKVLINSKNKTDNVESIYKIICNDVRVTSDSFVFNGGSFAGMVKIIDLTSKLNILVTEVNNLKTKFNTHKHLGVSTGSGVSGTTNTLGTNATPFNKSDYENTKIKH